MRFSKLILILMALIVLCNSRNIRGNEKIVLNKTLYELKKDYKFYKRMFDQNEDILIVNKDYRYRDSNRVLRDQNKDSEEKMKILKAEIEKQGGQVRKY